MKENKMVSYALFMMLLILVFAGIIGAVITICYEGEFESKNKIQRAHMTTEHFNKVVEAIKAGKSDEEIMETLYVDKYDIHIVKHILEREKNKEQKHGD